MIVPVGMLRRMLGKDKLNLKAFKKGKDSVFHERDYLYRPVDFENTF
jgi:hypothetical protein